MRACPDAAQRNAVRVWVEAAMWDPRAVSQGAIRRPGRRGHPLHYAVVTGTDCMITYIVLDLPVRVLRIVNVLDAPSTS